MATLRYQHQPDELGTGTTPAVLDEDYSFGGIAFAAVAAVIAASSPAHAAVALGVDEDFQATTATATVDEDAYVPPRPTAASGSRLYLPDPDEVDLPLAVQDDGGPDWVIPVLLGNPPLPLPLILRDAEDDIPAGSLYGQPDEDFWRSGVAPIVAANRCALPWEPELDELPTTLSGAPDLDEVWRNPVPPVAGANRVPPPLWEAAEDPAGFLTGQPDEDFWVSGVPPVPGQNRVSLPLGDPEAELPAATLYGALEETDGAPARPWAPSSPLPLVLVDDDLPVTPTTVDEDGWVSGVQPTAQSNRVSIPAEEDVPLLAGQLDEDFSGPLPAPVQGRNLVLLPLVDVEELPAATLYGAPDLDDVWPDGLRPPSPTVASNRVSLPWEPELDELPTTLSGMPDEDFWVSGVPPTPASSRVALPLGDPESEQPALYGVPEEDRFSPPAPWPLATARPFTDTDEVPTQPLGYQPDEDFWVSGVAPVPGSSRVSLPLGDQDSEVPSLYGVAEEDSSAPRPVPVVASNRVSLPWEPDLDEISSALTGQPDEDFWFSGVPSVPGSSRVSLPLGDPDSEVPSLYGQPDEDFWANPVRPVVASNRVSLPWEPELDELPTTLSGQPDEDFWVSGVPPVVGSNRVSLPWEPELDELPTTLSGQPDEDFGPPLPAPVPPRSFVVLPLGDPDSEVPSLYGVPEEDAYRAPLFAVAPPIVAANVDDDFPPQTLPPDEDFWHVPIGVSPPLPPVVFLDGSASEWVPFISTQIVEDEPYLAPVARPTGNFLAPVYPWGTDEDVPRLFGVPEEDSTAPLPTQTRFPPLPVRAVAETDEPPAGRLSGTPDADEQWQNWVAPVQASNRVPPPLWELAEDPAGSLSGMPDEDFPGPLPRPVPPSSLVLLPVGDRDSETPLLRGAPEEDQYRAPVLPWPPLPPRVFTDTDERPSYLVEDEPYFAPVARPSGNFFALPFLPDADTTPRLFGVPEEDRYSAPIPPPPPLVRATLVDDEITIPAVDEDFPGPLPAPVVASHGRLYLPEPDGDSPAGSLFGMPDEDFPGPLPAPVQASHRLAFPHLADLNDTWVPFVSVSIGTDEDFYFPPRQAIPLPPLRAFQGIEDETRLIASNNSFARYLARFAPRYEVEREPPHPIPPTPYPARDEREAPHGVPFDDEDDGWIG